MKSPTPPGPQQHDDDDDHDVGQDEENQCIRTHGTHRSTTNPTAATIASTMTAALSTSY